MSATLSTDDSVWGKHWRKYWIKEGDDGNSGNWLENGGHLLDATDHLVEICEGTKGEILANEIANQVRTLLVRPEQPDESEVIQCYQSSRRLARAALVCIVIFGP